MLARSSIIRLAAVSALCGVAACGPADDPSPRTDEDAASGTPEAASAEAGVVEIVARDFAFDAPQEIPSGWTTIRMRNTGQQEHFAYIYRIPDDVTFEEFQQAVVVPFDTVWENYESGEVDRAGAEAALGAAIPEWFFTEVVPSGGPALTEPGETAVTTVNLEPGTYAIECYVKTPEGDWHTVLGMHRRLVVTEESNGAAPPQADAELTLTNYEIATSGDLGAGERTIAVHVEDRPEGFMMHDINLFRLEDDASANRLVPWMDWMDLEQFRAPAPGHSLGGVEHLPPGATGYMTVNLEPGDYAWVSEGYGALGMVHEFSVD